MTPDFMRQKPNAENDSDVKMKRRSAIERSETMDLSQLRRNNSFVDSRRFLEKPETNNSTRRQSNGWSDSIQDVTPKKPPMLSPRGSLKRTKDSDSSRNVLNGISEDSVTKPGPLSVSSSLSNMRKYQKDAETDLTPLSNSLSASNIKRVQEKSNKFLESLSSKESSPKRQQLLNSVSSSNIPKIMSEIAAETLTETKQNHRQILEDLKKTIAREAQSRNFRKVKIVDDDKKLAKFPQINEIYAAKSSSINTNQIHKIRTAAGKQYHVRVKTSETICDDAIDIHPVLAKVLGIEQSGEKIELTESKLVCNLIENIELVPLTDLVEGGLGHQIAKDMEEKFKKYVNTHSRILPLILNQGQVFKLDDYILTIKLFPLSTLVCCIDSEILRENAIEVNRQCEPNEFAPMHCNVKRRKEKEAKETRNVKHY